MRGTVVVGRLHREDWILAVLFAAAYGQWPLYTSNQYAYFVRGVARATGGPLASDWLVNATDHIPLFTVYVYVVTEWLWPGIFFLVHGALVVLYVLCLLFLARRVFELSPGGGAHHAFFLALTLLHSGALVLALSRLEVRGAELLVAAMGYATEGIAGQPLLRHFHQPSAFGVLLLLAMCLLLAGRERGAAVSAGLAAWFHPGYLPTSAVLASIWLASAVREKRYRSAAEIGTIWLAVSLPPLVYSLFHFWPSSPELASEARRILVHERYPHHGDPAIWFGWGTVFQLAIAFGASVLVRRDRALFRLMAGLLAVGSTLTLAQFVTRSDVLAVWLPWRLFVLVVPVSTALLVAAAVTAVFARAPRWGRGNGVRRAGVSLLAVAALAGIATTWRAVPRPAPAGELVPRVAAACASGDVYLIPPHWQSFRLETRCPIFIDRKSHPYRDVEVIEWWDRIRAAEAFYGAESPAARAERLETLSSRWRVTHVVVPDPSERWRIVDVRRDAR